MNQNLNREIMEIQIEDIIPNRFQPRLTFDTEALNELANSIREHGIIQPLVVRRVQDKFEIIAGERRYKAATLVGMKKVPCIIMELTDNESAEVAVIENIQRKEMTPLEEAKSFKKILDRGYLTQEQLAKRMGKSQSSIANKLRLLNLDEVVQDAILEGKISERHARSLLKIDAKQEQRNILSEIINNRLTVKQTDDLIKEKFGKGADTINTDMNNNNNMIFNNMNSNNGLEGMNNMQNINLFNNPQSNTNQNNIATSSIFKVPEPQKTANDEILDVSPNNKYMSTPEVNIPVNNVTHDVNPQLNLMNNLGMVKNEPPQEHVIIPNKPIQSSSLDIFKFDNASSTPQPSMQDIQSVINPSVLSEEPAQQDFQPQYAQVRPEQNMQTDPVSDYYKMNNVTNVDISQMKNNAQDIIQKEEPKQDISSLLTIDNKPANKFFVDLDMDNKFDSTASLPFKTKNAVESINKKLEELKLQGINIIKEESDLGNTYQIIIRIDK